MKYYATGKHVATEHTYAYAATHWRRNVVAAMMTGVLVAGTSLSPVALSGFALASQSDGDATVATTLLTDGEGTSDAGQDGAADENTAGDDAAEEDAAEDDESNTDTADEGTTNTSDADASNTSNISKLDTNATTTTSTTSTTTVTSSNADGNAEAASANEEFGEPTTTVVIEGSVNGEIMAQIALAEPDGTPEGGEYNKYNYGSGEPWCAYFVMYCARAAGLSTEVIPNYASCPMLVEYYKNLERWQPFTTEYRPHVGDLIFYSESVGGIASHVGIVTASTDTTVTTREGNTDNGKVATHVLSTTNEDGLVGNDFYILGYASPDYPEEVDHEHLNNIASVLDVSETAHLVTYEKCACGYEKPADLVPHNFKSTNSSLKLSESDEWECIDCGAEQTHYTTGIRTTSKAVTVYEPTTNAAKTLPAGSELTVTNVAIGTDGNYWGVTVEGYRVLMSEAGVKQTSLFAKLNMDEDGAFAAYAANAADENDVAAAEAAAVAPAVEVVALGTAAEVEQMDEAADAELTADEDLEAVEDEVADEEAEDAEAEAAEAAEEAAASAVERTATVATTTAAVTSTASQHRLVASYDSIELGNDATTAHWSAVDGGADATCMSLIKLQAGCMYVVTIDKVTSTADPVVAAKFLGSPMLKLMEVGNDGSYDINDMKVYGEHGQKLAFSDKGQGFTIAPEEDMTLVLACQYGKRTSANNVTYEGVNIYQVG